MSVLTTTIMKVDAQKGEGNSKEYSANYRVQTDDPNDGPVTVLNGFDGPDIGDGFNVRGERDNAARCVLIHPSPVEDSKLVWDVDVTWRTPSDVEESKPGQNGKPTNDPLRFASPVELSQQQMQRPVEKAILRSTIPPRPRNTMGPVVNSAGVIYDPPLEMDYAIDVVRVTRYLNFFPSGHWRSMTNAVNRDRFTIRRRVPRLNLQFEPFQCKMQSVGGSMQFINQVPLWVVQYEIHVDKTFGWRRDVLDRGRQKRIPEGTPEFYTLGAGVPAVKEITDNNGFPLRDPVLLNGYGQPLPPGAAPIYITYSVYPERPFRNLGL